MSGMDPNRAIIALLQMRSDKLVSRDYVRREIPMELNVTQEEQRVDIEEMRDSLRVAVAQYAQAIPALASQGQDPTQIISRIAEVIQGRQKAPSFLISKKLCKRISPVFYYFNCSLVEHIVCVPRGFKCCLDLHPIIVGVLIHRVKVDYY